MRVLQLIDSLRPGGAERMAINLANGLVPHVQKSFLCCTRIEGSLKKSLNSKVEYIFLGRKSTLDVEAVLKLAKFVKVNQIKIIHAHGTSYFLGNILKFLCPGISLVWHEHYGSRTIKKKWCSPVLYIFSSNFDGIIVVNKDLLRWVNKNLLCSNTLYIPNFISEKKLKRKESGRNMEKTRLVCLANLKQPKNHLNLLIAFKAVLVNFPNCTLNLVGKNYDDEYAHHLLDYVKRNDMGCRVKFIGEVTDAFSVLLNCDIGVLSSDAEGLPMALLEYGIAGLAVVCTNVGQCQQIIGENGRLVKVNDPEGLAKAIVFYLQNEETFKEDAINFQKSVLDNFSEKKILPRFKNFYSSLT